MNASPGEPVPGGTCGCWMGLGSWSSSLLLDLFRLWWLPRCCFHEILGRWLHGVRIGGGSFGLVFVGEPVGYLLTSLLAKPFRVVLSFSLSVVAVFLRVTTSSLSGLPYHAPSSMFPGRLTSRSPCSSVDFGISWSVSVACVPFSPSPSIRLSRVLSGSTRERCFPPCSVRWLVLVVAWMA